MIYNNIKISVIIPVYNVEKYLHQCLDSVINQTYKNLEIICIDDCSTDNSFQILKEYEKKDNRIIVLQNEVNSKLGPTRNHGMKYATGEYIHFLDSDDWLELDAYEKLAKIVEENGNIDVIYFQWREISNKTGVINEKYLSNKNCSSKTINIDSENRAQMQWCEQVWNKLYSKRFLEKFNIIFNDYKCHEDMEYSLKVRINVRNIYYLDNILINYRIDRLDSLMAKHSAHSKEVFKSYYNAEKWCKSLDKSLCQHLLGYELVLLYNHTIRAYNNHYIQYNELKKLFKTIDYSLINSSKYRTLLLDISYIIKFPEYIYIFIIYTKKFMKYNFPSLYKYIVEIRKKSEGKYNDKN